MDIIVVAEEKLAFFARNLAHAISLQPKHSASYWTDKHYRDNEAQIGGKQGVVFLGRNSVSEDYVQMLPLVFEDFQVFCHSSGRKAVIFASPDPALLDNGDKVDALQKRVKALLETAKGHKKTVLTASFLMATTPTLLLYTIALGGLPFLAWKLAGDLKRRQEIEKMQYTHGIAKFLQDVFPRFASDN